MPSLSEAVAELARANDYFLYHTCPPTVLESILKMNALVLPLSETNESEAHHGGDKLYYLSLARSMASGYIADRSPGLRKVNYPCVIVFNEHKLEQLRGVTLRPYEYWTGDRPTGRHLGSSREAEERLFSHQHLLHGVLKTIAEIRFMVFTGQYDNNFLLRKVYSLAKKKHIKTKLFTMDNFQGFLYGVEKPEDRDQAFAFLKTSKDDTFRRSGYEHKPSQSYWRHLLEYVYEDSLGDLTQKARSELYYLVNGYSSKNEFYERYKTDVHNLRAESPRRKAMFDRMLKHMHAKSLKGFFAKLDTKWTKLYNDR